MKRLLAISLASVALVGLGVMYVPAVGNAVRLVSEKTGVSLPDAAESTLAGGSHARFSTGSSSELRELSDDEGAGYNKLKWPDEKSKKKKSSEESSELSLSGVIEQIAPEPDLPQSTKSGKAAVKSR